MGSFRKERVADLLMGFVANELRDCRDPRLAGITVTSLEMSPDLKSARVYWSSTGVVPDLDTVDSLPQSVAFPKDDEIKEIEKALYGVRGFLKKRIAKDLTLRFVPNLHFKHDSSAVVGSQIDKLLSLTHLSEEE